MKKIKRRKEERNERIHNEKNKIIRRKIKIKGKGEETEGKQVRKRKLG